LSKRLLPLIPAGLIVDQVIPEADRILILTRPRTPRAPCPACGRSSDRLHSHYTRTFADLPWQGRAVTIQVRARRLRCATAGCPRRIFTERLAGVARPHGRRTDRLGDVQRHLGLALGGEAGARLAERLSLPVSAATLLRLVRGRRGGQSRKAPRVLGVDDWAWRRGQRYGTIVCDLERRKVVDLLPDREATTLAAWLRDHPGIEIVARDRAGAYADGVRQGAPQAIQVADRWHLLRNCSDALLQVLDRHRGAFGRVANGVAHEAKDVGLSPEIRPATKAEEQRRKRQADRDTRFNTVTDLARAGLGVRAIVRETGLARNTVRRWMRSGAAPNWRKGERDRITDPFLPYLQQRLSEGMGNATQLWREIRHRGFRGQVITVRAAVAKLKGGPSHPKRSPAPVWRRPTPRRTARALLSDATATEMDQRFYDALLEAAPDVRRAVDEARAFVGLVRERNRDALEPWLKSARGGPLSGFVEGLRRDLPAVVAALVHPWSTGPVEGQITRLKLIKRQMFGRANLDLLRARVLAA
jgi:transposase